MVVKIALFDGDGTLWDFKKDSDKDRTINDANLNPDAKRVLRYLNKKGIKCVLITFQKHNNKNYSRRKIKAWLERFGIFRYIDEIKIVDKEEKYKDNAIIQSIRENGFYKKDAIFVGDRYKWDYLPAKRAGVKFCLMDKPENKSHRVKKINLGDLINIVK